MHLKGIPQTISPNAFLWIESFLDCFWKQNGEQREAHDWRPHQRGRSPASSGGHLVAELPLGLLKAQSIQSWWWHSSPLKEHHQNPPWSPALFTRA